METGIKTYDQSALENQFQVQPQHLENGEQVRLTVNLDQFHAKLKKITFTLWPTHSDHVGPVLLRCCLVVCFTY